ITGEGLPGNVPRVLPPGCRVRLRRASWEVPPVFRWLQRLGDIEQPEMDMVFNQGIGFVAIVRRDSADAVRLRLSDESKLPTHVIGEVIEGEPDVEWNT